MNCCKDSSIIPAKIPNIKKLSSNFLLKTPFSSGFIPTPHQRKLKMLKQIKWINLSWKEKTSTSGKLSPGVRIAIDTIKSQAILNNNLNSQEVRNPLFRNILLQIKGLQYLQKFSLLSSTHHRKDQNLLTLDHFQVFR